MTPIPPLRHSVQSTVSSFQHLVESTPPKSQRVSRSPVISFLWNLVFGDSSQFHGKAHVSTSLQNRSNTVCCVASTANLINVLTAIPALYFGFVALGPLGLALTGAVSGLVLKFSNDSAAASVASSKKDVIQVNHGLLTFVTINVLLTLLSGVGSELLTNRTGLSLQLAKELAEEQLAQSQPQEPDMSKYTEAASTCATLLNQVDSQPADSPNRDELLVRAKGEYSKWSQDWTTIARSQIPPCWLKDMGNTDPAWLNYQEQFKAWQTASESRSQSGNDLQFLKHEFPELYGRHFAEDGFILAGTEEFRFALRSFWQQLLSLNPQDVGMLGFSLFMFMLSLVTSAGACIALIDHARRQDTRLSFNDNSGEAVLNHLLYLEKACLGEHDTSIQLEPGSSDQIPVQKRSTHDRKTQNNPGSSSEEQIIQSHSHSSASSVNCSTGNYIRAAD